MTYKYNLFFWRYISIILTFGELIGIVIPKMMTRIVYIVIIGIWAISKIVDRKGRISITIEKTLVGTYFGYVVIRYISQCFGGITTDVTTVSFAQLALPIMGFYMSKDLSENDCLSIEGFFCLCTSLSVILGMLDGVIHFIPESVSISNKLYAYVSGGNTVLRGYTMAGSALITGFICALSACFVLGNNRKLFEKKWIKYGVFGLSIIGLLRSYSRGALAFFLIMAIVYAYRNIEKNGGKLSWKTIAMATSIILFTVFFTVIKYKEIVQSSFFQRFVSIALSMDERSNRKRQSFQMTAISKIMENPLVGKGFGFSGYQALSRHVDGAVNTESYFISLLLGIGIIGLFLFVLIILYEMSISRKNIYGQDLKYISIVLGLTVWSIMYIVLDSDLNGLFFWYCIGQLNYS